jgi:hypothetical protein
MEPGSKPPPPAESGPRSRLLEAAVLTVGAGLVAAGAVAVFITHNDAGTAALLAVGTVFVALAVVGDRIQTIKYRELEIQLAEQHAEHAERRADLAFRAAAELESAGNPEEAARFRSEGLEELRELRSIGKSYLSTRSTMPSGWERTMRMEEDFRRARQEASRRHPTPDQVDRLLRGDDGERISGLAAMAEIAELRDFDRVHRVIEECHSPFEQFHALGIVEGMVPRLTPGQRERLRRTLVVERRRFGDDRSRHNVADRIEAALRSG